MSAELERERRALAKSLADLSEGRGRVDRQRVLTAELRMKGLDTGEAERLLDLLRETLAQWQEHHVLIVERIAHLERRDGGAGVLLCAPAPPDPGHSDR